MNIYELGEDELRLVDWLEEDPENEAIKETLGMILLDIDTKIDGYCGIIRRLEADGEALKKEKMRLAAKQAAAENGAKRLREQLKSYMLLTGRKKLKTTKNTVSTSTRWKAFLDADPKDIPEEFKKVTVEAKMAEIEKYLKGYDPKLEAVPASVCEWAHLEQVESLTIR